MRSAVETSAIGITIRATVLDQIRDLERESDPHLVEHMVTALLGFALNLDRTTEAEFQRRLRATLTKI